MIATIGIVVSGVLLVIAPIALCGAGQRTRLCAGPAGETTGAPTPAHELYVQLLGDWVGTEVNRVDGSAPTTASTPYTGPITVTTTQTITAMASATNFLQSLPSSQTYTLQNQVAAPTFSPATSCRARMRSTLPTGSRP